MRPLFFYLLLFALSFSACNKKEIEGLKAEISRLENQLNQCRDELDTAYDKIDFIHKKTKILISEIDDLEDKVDDYYWYDYQMYVWGLETQMTYVLDAANNLEKSFK